MFASREIHGVDVWPRAVGYNGDKQSISACCELKLGFTCNLMHVSSCTEKKNKLNHRRTSCTRRDAHTVLGLWIHRVLDHQLPLPWVPGISPPHPTSSLHGRRLTASSCDVLRVRQRLSLFATHGHVPRSTVVTLRILLRSSRTTVIAEHVCNEPTANAHVNANHKQEEKRCWRVRVHKRLTL